MATDPIISPQRRRRVDSGTWPLYVILLVSTLAASVVQLIRWESSPSVAEQSPGWFDTWFIVVQPVGAIVVLVALFAVRNLVASLQLERIGCLALITVGLAYVFAVILNRTGLPTGYGTWLSLGFSTYCAYRVHEITKTFGTDLLRPFRPLGRRLLRRKETR